MKSIILIGDSIRMGYQDTVKRLIGDQAEVWGPSENGGNSENVLSHLEEWILARRPDVVHINCGLHDMKRESGATECAVSLARYEKNIADILGRVLSGTSAHVVWASSTPVNQEWHHEKKDFDRFANDSLAYNEAASRTATALGVPINDLFSVVESAGRDELLQPDGVHYGERGYEMLGKAVADFVRPYVAAQGAT